MTFSSEKLQAARNAGYSDDEIYSHLQKSEPKLKVAQEHGYSLEDVAAHFSKSSGVTATGGGVPVASADSTSAPATTEAPAPNPVAEFGKAFSGTLLPQVAGIARVAGLKGVAEFLNDAVPTQSPDESLTTGIAHGAGSAAALLAEAAATRNPFVPAVAMGLGAYDTAYNEAKGTGKSDEEAVNAARVGMLKTVPQMAAYVIGIGTGTKLGGVIANRLGFNNVGAFLAKTFGGAAGGQAVASGEAAIRGESPVPTPGSITQNLIFGVGGAVHGLAKGQKETDAKLDSSINEAENLAKAEVAKPGEPNALSKPEATQPDVNMQQPIGTPEGAGQVPAAEGGAGVPARGQGAEVRAQEVTETPVDPNIVAVPEGARSYKVQSGGATARVDEFADRIVLNDLVSLEEGRGDGSAVLDALKARGKPIELNVGRREGDTAAGKLKNFYLKRGFEEVPDNPDALRYTPPEVSEPGEIAATGKAPAAERPAAEAKAPDVEPHLKTAPEVQKILDEQPTETAPEMKAPEVPPEAGAAGGTGGRRLPPPQAVGTTPRGDLNWLRIPAWFKRIGRGLFTEGARHVLGRTRNAVGQALARATRRHVDVEQELFGQHEKILRDAVSSIPRGRRDAAFTEVSQHIRDIENGRPATPLQPDAQGLLDAWYDIGEKTGNIARANNVQVFDAAIGSYRPMGHVRNYIPRMFSSEVESALRDPESNPSLYNSLVDAISTHRGISTADAAKELHSVGSRFSSNDFHGNLELARNEQLPEIFYEYDLRNLASRYLPAFSERMGQIIAYGQRLGSREQPMRKNLWDIARGEARDADTQQWLNAAEDQATGFKAKSVIERNARRGQAIANATLLSDPTTTVMRNLLSGLAVTTERFGVGRSIRALKEAAKSASGLDAREMGALREDIGSFLGAEQLGDSKLDSAIRGTQQTMLKYSGFNASENFVRRHQAMTASSFARDAAAALTRNPRSALAREALAQFKRFDIDPEAIVAEGGNWRTGPETRKYIRTVIRESQGGYRFDQVPVWAGTTAGRFLYQYGRWGIQRANDIFKNTIRPALGEKVEFRGQNMTRRNVLPLMRLGLLTVGLGEGFSGIASVLFNKDRRDSSFSEIGEQFNEDESKAVGLLGERVLNDVIMAGTLGLIGQPIDFAKSLKDQSRFKNPAEPPSLAGTKALIDLAMRAKDQGGTLTKRDLLDTAKSVLRGPTNVSEVVRNVAGDKLYEAQNDQRTLRNAARRWAKSQGMDVSSRVGFDSVRKTLNAPVFEAINEALLSGDADKARQLRNDFVDSKKTDAEQKKAAAAVASSVEGRHPFRAGPFTAKKHRDAFEEWAQKNLSKDDRAQIERVISTYEETKQAADL